MRAILSTLTGSKICGRCRKVVVVGRCALVEVQLNTYDQRTPFVLFASL